MTRILVTGAAGFVGTNFLQRIKDKPDFQVTATYHTNEPKVRASNIRYIQANLLNINECLNILKDIEMVYMFAGRITSTAILADNPLAYVSENTIINVNMLEAAYLSGIKKYLWLSSTTGYPAAEKALKENNYFDGTPESPFEAVGQMFRYIERLSYFYSIESSKPMTVISLRPTAIFGEYDDLCLCPLITRTGNP